MQSRSSTVALAAVLLVCLSSSRCDALLFGVPAAMPAVNHAAAAAVSHVAEAPARELMPDFAQVRVAIDSYARLSIYIATPVYEVKCNRHVHFP
jgi:hypothetical protein